MEMGSVCGGDDDRKKKEVGRTLPSKNNYFTLLPHRTEIKKNTVTI